MIQGRVRDEINQRLRYRTRSGSDGVQPSNQVGRARRALAAKPSIVSLTVGQLPLAPVKQSKNTVTNKPLTG